jgi:ribonuclease P protein component
MLEMKSNKFTKAMRLTRSTDFDHVFAQGRQFKAPGITIRIIANDIGTPRLGISIGKRFGNAPQRNRMKRKIREAFRHIRSALPHCDIVCVPHPAARDLSVDELKEIIQKNCENFDAKPDH